MSLPSAVAGQQTLPRGLRCLQVRRPLVLLAPPLRSYLHVRPCQMCIPQCPKSHFAVCVVTGPVFFLRDVTVAVRIDQAVGLSKDASSSGMTFGPPARCAASLAQNPRLLQSSLRKTLLNVCSGENWETCCLGCLCSASLQCRAVHLSQWHPVLFSVGWRTRAHSSDRVNVPTHLRSGLREVELERVMQGACDQGGFSASVFCSRNLRSDV